MSKQIMIGSTAIKHFYPDFPREPKDVDYISDKKKTIVEPDGTRVEYHINPIFDDYRHLIMLPVDLLTLKASHIFWDNQWEKHMFDIVFLTSKSHRINVELFNRLRQHWCMKFGEPKRSDLTKTADQFFDNALKEYDHDYLHTLINPIPTYTYVLKGEVEPDENKFNFLTFEQKLELVREEIYVMAYERLRGRDYRSAYSWMLKRFIMYHAPMWEVIFILENYRILHKPIFNYKEKLDNELSRVGVYA